MTRAAYSRKSLLGLTPPEDEPMNITAKRMASGRHGAGTVAESSHPDPRAQGGRGAGAPTGSGTSKPAPSDTPLQ